MATFVHHSIRVDKPGTEDEWVDLEEYVMDYDTDVGDVQSVGTESGGGDGVVGTAKITFLSTNDYNLSPLDESSSANTWNGQFEPLLSAWREVNILVAKTHTPVRPGPEDDAWEPIFRGYIDTITTSRGRVTCDCRDQAMLLQETFVEEPTPILEPGDPDMALDDILQKIIDELVEDVSITIYTPSGTEEEPIHEDERPTIEYDGEEDIFMVSAPEEGDETYGAEYENVWEFLQGAVVQIGWFLGYRWHDPTDDFQLVLMRPDVDKTIEEADWTFDENNDFMLDPQVEVGLDNIRNVAEIVYSDEEDPVVEYDQDSIDNYRRRYMKIERHNCGLLTHYDEARNMALQALEDLKDPMGFLQADLMMEPRVKPFDGIKYKDTTISDNYQFMGVQSVRHSARFGNNPSFRTTINGQGSVKGGSMRWLRREARAGASKPVQDEERGTQRAMLKPTTVAVESAVGALDLKFERPRTRRWAESEIHVSTESDFIPGDSTEYTRAKNTHFGLSAGLSLGTDYYIKVANRDDYGNKSDYIEVGPVQIDDYPDGIDIPANVEFKDAECGFDDRGLTLIWGHVEWASQYELRYDTNFGEDDANLITHTGDDRYTFVPADRNVTIYIKAKNSRGDYSEEYDTFSDTNDVPETMSAPSVSSQYHNVRIEFDRIAGDSTIQGYVIDVDVNGTTEEIDIGNRRAYEFRAEQDDAVSARVRAYDYQGNGSWSPWSATIDVKWPVPDTPTSLSGEFVWDVRFEWDSMPYAEKYEVEVDPDGESMYVITTSNNSYRITSPSTRQYDVRVRAFNQHGESSEWSAPHTESKAAPSPPEPPISNVVSFFKGIRAVIEASTSSGVLYHVVEWSWSGNTEERRVNAGDRVMLEADTGKEVSIRVKAVDVVGAGDWSSTEVESTATLDDVAEFAATLKPPDLVDELPALPSDDYPEGSLIVWTEDKKLYKNVSDSWTDDFDHDELTVFQNIVASTIIAGAVGATEIAAGAITAEKVSVTEELAAEFTQFKYTIVDELDASEIDVTNLNADNITTGSLNAERLQIGDFLKAEDGALTVDYIDASDVDVINLDADNITSGTIATEFLRVGDTDKHPSFANAKPPEGKLWYFDRSLMSTCGIKPESGAVATLRPNEGKFGGAVDIESLAYKVDIGTKWTWHGSLKLKEGEL